MYIDCCFVGFFVSFFPDPFISVVSLVICSICEG